MILKGARAQVPAHSISVPEKKAPESEFSEMPEPDETKIETEIPAPIHADTEITDIHSQPLKSESETTAPEPHKDRKKRKRHELKPHTKKKENSSSKGKSKLSFSKKRVPEQTVSPFDIDYDGYYDDVLPRDYNRESEHFIDKDTIKKIVLIFAGSMCCDRTQQLGHDLPVRIPWNKTAFSIPRLAFGKRGAYNTVREIQSVRRGPGSLEIRSVFYC